MAGTTTPASTYTSRTGDFFNANPIVLDSAGRTPNEIWLTGGVLYFALKNLGVTDWVADISTMSTIFTLRMLAIRYDWQFPTLEWKY